MLRNFRKAVFTSASFNKASLNQPINQLFLNSFKSSSYQINESYSTGKFNNSNPENHSSNKYKSAFQDLQNKVKIDNSQDQLNKMAKENAYADIKKKIHENLKFTNQGSSSQKLGAQPHMSPEEKLHRIFTNQEETQRQEDRSTARMNASAAARAAERVSIVDRILKQYPRVGKVLQYVQDSWEQTFPKDNYKKKTNLARHIARKAKEEELCRVYSEEELIEMQLNIPEWKRTAMTSYKTQEEFQTWTQKLRQTIGEKLGQTSIAQDLKKSEEFKQYREFKTEMKQFKEDFKDHLNQSQNPAVIASLAILNRVGSDSSTARAIKEMKNFDKNFDVFELEKDAKGIFSDVYNTFLSGDVELLEKMCSDMALGYFKALIKKREVDGVSPKYTELWDCDSALLIGGQVPEKKLPCFTFTISTQEIHCNVSKKSNKIVDGAEDRIIQNQYNFVLTINQNPDLELVGHKWEIIEIQQIGHQIALV